MLSQSMSCRLQWKALNSENVCLFAEVVGMKTLENVTCSELQFYSSVYCCFDVIGCVKETSKLIRTEIKDKIVRFLLFFTKLSSPLLSVVISMALKKVLSPRNKNNSSLARKLFSVGI